MSCHRHLYSLPVRREPELLNGGASAHPEPMAAKNSGTATSVRFTMSEPPQHEAYQPRGPGCAAALVRLLPHVMPAVMLVGASSAIAVPLLNSPIELDVTRAMRSRAGLGVAMVVAVVLIAGLAYWDAERESAAALEDFAQEQATLASALGGWPSNPRACRNPLRGKTMYSPKSNPSSAPSHLRFSFALRVRPAAATDGREVSSPRLMAALRDGQSVVRIPREEAAAFGLPARTALAGLSRVDAGGGRHRDILAVATPARARSRDCGRVGVSS